MVSFWEEHIEGVGKQFLPKYKRDMMVVEFQDCLYLIKKNEVISKEEFELKTKQNDWNHRLPFKYFSCTYEYASENEPQIWLQIVRNSFPDHNKVKQFYHDFGVMFHPKVLRSKSLFIYGPDTSGKTSLSIPLYEIYGQDRIGTIYHHRNFN